MNRDLAAPGDFDAAKLAIITCAKKMLAGEIDLIDGCRTILRYRDHLGDRMGALFDVFEGVHSETDDFPVGASRDDWGTDALRRKDQEKEEYLRRAKAPLLEACKTIISRLSN
jgi:hypothetical protein